MIKRLLTSISLLISFYAQAQIAQQWVNRYTYKDTAAPWEDADIAYGVAIDAQSNVVVTGSSMRGGPDIVTIKYNASGSELWRAVYGSPSAGTDGANAVAVDGQGNVFVTGGTTVSGLAQFLTIKYNSSGVQQWTAGSAKGYSSIMSIDPQGNVVVCGYNDSQSYDIITAKYSPSGAELWTRRYLGPGKYDDYPKAVKTDAAGNIYITGESRDSTGQAFEMVTIKYDPAGNLQWDRFYKGSTTKDDRGTALALDPTGNVIVAGSTNVDASAPWMTDFITIKYDASGTKLWEKKYNGPANSADGAVDVVVDAAGNIYAGGVSLKSAGSEDYFVIKYNSTGDSVWTGRYNSNTGNSQTPRVMAIDARANVYMSGSSQGPTGRDFQTIKYDSAGVRKWVMRYNGPAGPGDEPYAIAVNASGVVAVAGSSQGTTSSLDYATVVYSDSALVGIEERFASATSAEVVAFPNPTTTNTTLQYVLMEDALVTIEIVDLLGRKVETIDAIRQSSGVHSVSLDCSHLRSGIYFCKLQAGAAQATTRLVIGRR